MKMIEHHLKALGYKPPKTKHYRQYLAYCLQACYDNPDHPETQSIFGLMFDRSFTPTVAHTLRYCYGLSYKEFNTNFQISRPTFNLWTTGYQVKKRHAPRLIFFISQLEPHPLTPPALSNLSQWSTTNRETYFHPSIAQIRAAQAQMREFNEVSADSIPGKNYAQKAEQLRIIASTFGWRPVDLNTYALENRS